MDPLKLKLVYFHSDEIVIDNMIWGLLELGVETENPSLRVPLQEYRADVVPQIEALIQGRDGVATQNFSAAVAQACYLQQIPYIAWIYDSPQRALYMKEAFYPTNYIFVFDKTQKRRLEEIGLKQVFHCPLGANIAKTSMLQITDEDIRRYTSDISFVGNMYDRDHCIQFMQHAPQQVREEMEDLLGRLALKWHKGDTVAGCLDGALLQYIDSIADHSAFSRYCMEPQYAWEILTLVPLLANRERYMILDELSRRCRTCLYTGQPEKIEGLEHVIKYGKVDYNTEAYKVYFSSRINLNITMRGIETGIPQRVFDVMSVGGFMLSNYQEEAQELFEPDKEIVLFESMEELLDKADYYLRHERERLRIAMSGYQRVKEDYSVTGLMQRILTQVYC